LEERSPMAARTKTKVSPEYKTKYRVKNWAAYVALSILEQIEGIARFTADGAFDSRPMYEALAAAGVANIKIVIPPKKTAPWIREPVEASVNDLLDSLAHRRLLPDVLAEGVDPRRPCAGRHEDEERSAQEMPGGTTFVA
ncbi:MAG: hypothetical protein AAEJ53_09455, partial [Myxococcota bacterium]